MSASVWGFFISGNGGNPCEAFGKLGAAAVGTVHTYNMLSSLLDRPGSGSFCNRFDGLYALYLISWSTKALAAKHSLADVSVL